MTTTFTASNGVQVSLEPNRYGQDHMRTLVVAGGQPGHTFPVAYHNEELQALREYFTAERDELLGRWRDPEEPDCVAYRIRPSVVRVIDERYGTKHDFGRHDSPEAFHARLEPEQYRAAARYFAAHPEKKPWHSAQSGELWLLTINGEQVGALAWRPAPGLQFETATGTLRHDDPDITAGRRLWPEETDDE